MIPHKTINRNSIPKDPIPTLVEIQDNIELAQIALKGWNDMLRVQINQKKSLIERHGSLKYELYLLDLKIQVSKGTKRLRELRSKEEQLKNSTLKVVAQ